jgi:DNA-binding transcriptional MerR regulator
MENTKLYYSIGEVAEMLQVNASLLRYWEKEFDMIKPRKNAKGDRLFTRDDIEKLKLVYHLVKEKGYTLEGAKIQLKGGADILHKKLQITERLKKVRSFLAELKDEMEG